MAQHKLREQIIELWEELGTLSQNDPFFHKKRMFLLGKLSIYTKVFATVSRIDHIIENS